MAPRSGYLYALLALLCAAAARAQVPAHCKNGTLSYDISFIGPLKKIKVGSVTYGYHRFGPLNPDSKASLHPLIMLSGFGTYMYIHPVPILQRSAADREVIIFDHMRVGASANDTNRGAPLTIPMMAKGTADFIKALKIDTPDLYGWSLGGAIVTTMAVQHGSSFRYGVIVNGFAGGTKSYVMPGSSLDALLAIRNDVNKYLDLLFPDGAADEGACALFATWNSFYSSPYAKVAQPVDEQVIKEQYAAVQRFNQDNSVVDNVPSVIKEQYAAVQRFNQDNSVVDNLPSVRNRLLVFAGTQDRLVPVRNADVISYPVAGSWRLRFAGEGHGLPFESPRAVIYLMAEFWNFASPLTDADVAGMSYGVHPDQKAATPAAAAGGAKAPAAAGGAKAPAAGGAKAPAAPKPAPKQAAAAKPAAAKPGGAARPPAVAALSGAPAAGGARRLLARA